MSTIELRKRLFEKIQLTEDENLLEEASRLLEVNLDENSIYILSDKQEQAIKEASKQIVEGSFLSNEDANKEIDEWLKK